MERQVNGIANSYSERCGIVHMVGSPNSRALGNRSQVVHHTLGDGRQDVFLKIATNITVAQAKLDARSLASSAAEIDRVLKACVTKRQPIYIDIPTDVVYAAIPNAPLETPLTMASIRKELSEPGQYSALLDHVVRRIIAILNAAKRPIIIVGEVPLRCDALTSLAQVDMCAIRFGVLPLVIQMIEETGIPFVTTPMAKAASPEDHPLFRGVYCGKVSHPDVYSLVQTCDLGFSVGRMRSDMNSGAFSYVLVRT
jgi:pyruvate decarboxylase